MMDDPRRRYHMDPNYRQAVDFMRRWLHNCEFTVEELAKAVVLAAQMHAEDFGVRTMLVLKKEHHLVDEPKEPKLCPVCEKNMTLQNACQDCVDHTMGGPVEYGTYVPTGTDFGRRPDPSLVTEEGPVSVPLGTANNMEEMRELLEDPGV